MKRTHLLVLVCVALVSGSAVARPGDKHPHGLNAQATAELKAAGVDKYVGDFEPAVTTPYPDGWLKHTFNPDGGNGPI